LSLAGKKTETRLKGFQAAPFNNCSLMVISELLAFANSVGGYPLLRMRARRRKHTGSLEMLFFCPEAGIVQHQTLMRVLALMAVDAGHAAAGVSCWSLYERCPAISAIRPPASISEEERKQICRRCLVEALDEPDRYKLPRLWLPEYWTSESDEKLAEALDKFDHDPLGNILSNIAFGRLCTLDVALACKACSFADLKGDHLAIWRQLVASAVTSYLLVHEIYRQFHFRHFIYFNDYATNLAGALAARENGSRIASISQASNQNIDRRRVLIFPDFVTEHNTKILQRWPKWRNLSLTKARIEEIGADAIMRLSGQGSHVYSVGLGQLPDRLASRMFSRSKRVVAFTSSLDEVSSAALQMEALTGTALEYSSPFTTDVQNLHNEWLQSVAAWADSRGDIELVIRVHPREGANKREKESSAHLAKLRTYLAKLPECCSVIWPEDEISSYQLGETADVVLTSWSTIGLEFARLGTPVLCATSGLSPLPNESFHRFEADKRGYFTALEELLNGQSTLNDIVLSYRFWNFLILGCALELDDIVPSPDWSGKLGFKPAANSGLFLDAMRGRQSALDINERHWQSIQSDATAKEETAAVREQCTRVAKRLLHLPNEIGTLYFIANNTQSSQRADAIANIHAAEKQAGNFSAIVAIGHDGYVIYKPEGSERYQTKYSPLIARLLPLVCPPLQPEK